MTSKLNIVYFTKAWKLHNTLTEQLFTLADNLLQIINLIKLQSPLCATVENTCYRFSRGGDGAPSKYKSDTIIQYASWWVGSIKAKRWVRIDLFQKFLLQIVTVGNYNVEMYIHGIDVLAKFVSLQWLVSDLLHI